MVPLILQVKGENSATLIFFFAILLLDLFACHLPELIKNLTTRISICLQRYFTDKLKERIYSYSLLKLLSQKFVSCNFITNNTVQVDLHRVAVHESSFFGSEKRDFRLIISKAGEVDFLVCDKRSCKGEGITVMGLSKDVADNKVRFTLILKAGEQELNRREYTCSTRVGLLVHMLKYGTLWLCPLISNNGQGAVKRFHCFNVKFSIDKTSNTDEMYDTMSLEFKKYAIFYPLLFRTG